MADAYIPTLRDMLVNNAAWYGDTTAYVYGDTRLTHREYALAGRKLASALNRLGVQPQDRVGMLGMNSLDYCVIYGACKLYGFVASTVNFRLAAAEMQYVIDDAAQKVLIFEDIYTGHIEQIRGQLKNVEHYIAIGKAPDWALSFDTLLASGDEAGPDLPAPAPTDLAFLMYTSGTTGRPKGVMLEQGAQVNNGRFCAGAMRLGPEDRTLLMMPFFHVGAKAIEIAALWTSGTVYIHRTFDPEVIFRTIEQERITATHMAPTMIQTLLEHPAREKYDLSSLKVLLYSAAPMPTPVLRRALKAFGPIFIQMYGQTEGSGTMLPIVAHNPDSDARDTRRLGSIGHPIPGCRFKVVDEQENEVADGQPGELCFQGATMMRGYWNNSVATIDAMRGGWIHTGDIATRDEDGYLYLVDRKKDMIVSGGENVASREVEEALLQHPSVSEVAVIGIPHEKWGEAVCAIVVPVLGTAPTEDEIIAHSRSLIAGYKRPQSVHFVAELPKLPSGKVTKIELRKQFAKPVG